MSEDINRSNELAVLYNSGKSMADCAAATGLPLDTVRYRLRQAQVRMRPVGRRRMDGQRVLLTLSGCAVARLDELALGTSRSAAVEGLLSRSVTR